MDSLLKKYNIRHKYQYQEYAHQCVINYNDVCKNILKIASISSDKSYITEDKFLNLLTRTKSVNCQEFMIEYYEQVITEVPKEIIKPIPGYETRYTISSLGYIYSLKKGIILKQQYSNGYLALSLSGYKCKKTWDVHILMALTFLQKPTDGRKYVVDHINNIKTDNRLENLRYCTYSKNIKSAYENGYEQPAKLIVCKMDENNNVLERYESLSEAARQNGAKEPSSIIRCCKGSQKTAAGFKWRYSSQNKNKKIEIFDDEIFKPIPKFKSHRLSIYNVSNYGKVKNINTGNILSNVPDGDGYDRLHLYDDSKQYVNCFVHRLVALAFLDQPTKKTRNKVNHIDENKSNNHVSNLEWVTNRKNIVHSTGKPVIQMDKKSGKIIDEFDSLGQAKRKLGFKGSTGGSINDCCHGRCKTAYGYKWEFK